MTAKQYFESDKPWCPDTVASLASSSAAELCDQTLRKNRPLTGKVLNTAIFIAENDVDRSESMFGLHPKVTAAVVYALDGVLPYYVEELERSGTALDEALSAGLFIGVHDLLRYYRVGRGGAVSDAAAKGLLTIHGIDVTKVKFTAPKCTLLPPVYE